VLGLELRLARLCPKTRPLLYSLKKVGVLETELGRDGDTAEKRWVQHREPSPIFQPNIPTLEIIIRNPIRPSSPFQRQNRPNFHKNSL